MKIYKDSFGKLWIDNETCSARQYSVSFSSDNLRCIIRNIDTQEIKYNGLITNLVKENLSNYTNRLDFETNCNSFFVDAPITAEEVDAKIGAEVDILSDRIDTVEGIANAASSGSLGSIKPTDAAPTPARNGNYTFSIGGAKPAWLTAEAGITTVKAGDGVAVVYTAPSTYSYTHIKIDRIADIYNVTNEVPLSSGSFYTESTALTAVPIAVRKKGLKITFEVEYGVWVEKIFLDASISNFTNLKFWQTLTPVNLTSCISKNDIFTDNINIHDSLNSGIGYINDDGISIGSDTGFRYTPKFIKVSPSSTYNTIRLTIYKAFFYTNNFRLISVSSTSITTFTTPSNCEYIKYCSIGAFAVYQSIIKTGLTGLDSYFYPFNETVNSSKINIPVGDLKIVHKSINIFNPANRLEGKIVDAPQTGFLYSDKLVDNASFYETGMMPVEFGKTYSAYSNISLIGTLMYYFYDYNGRIIARKEWVSSVTIDSLRVKYISTYINNAYSYSTLFVKEGSAPTKYIAYDEYASLNDEELAKKTYVDSLLDGTAKTTDIISMLDYAKTAGLSQNIKPTLLSLSNGQYIGKRIETSDIGSMFETAINEMTGRSGNVLYPFYIELGATYYFYHGSSVMNFDTNAFVILLDKNRNIIARIATGSAENYTVTNTNAVYMSYQVSQGWVGACVTKYSSYNRYEQLMYKNFFLAKKQEVNNWVGKKWCSYGDSITHYGFWQTFISQYFQTGTHYLRGFSGSRITNIDPKQWWVNSVSGAVYDSINSYPTADPTWENPILINDNFSSQERINTIPLDAELVMVMGGTNDTSTTPVAGDCIFNAGTGKFNESTLKGAICETIRKIQIRVPNAIIVFVTPLSGLGSYSDGVNYNQTFKLESIATAIKEACFYMSTPCIDLFGTCGINISNSSTYLKIDKTHPTYGEMEGVGSAMMARAIIGGLRTILPFDVLSDLNFPWESV